jgi:hypothetical protein
VKGGSVKSEESKWQIQVSISLLAPLDLRAWSDRMGVTVVRGLGMEGARALFVGAVDDAVCSSQCRVELRTCIRDGDGEGGRRRNAERVAPEYPWCQ